MKNGAKFDQQKIQIGIKNGIALMEILMEVVMVGHLFIGI
jgi:hypothetical protein